MDIKFLTATLKILEDHIIDLEKFSVFSEDLLLDEVLEFKGHFETLQSKFYEATRK